MNYDPNNNMPRCPRCGNRDEYGCHENGGHEYGYHDQPGMPRFDGNVWTVRIGFCISIISMLLITYALIFGGP